MLPSLIHTLKIFLERIMTEALEEHDGKVKKGTKIISNQWFADDIDAQAEEEQELEALVDRLDKTCKIYQLEISAEYTKLMQISANSTRRRIKVKGQDSGNVTSCKYLGAVVSDIETIPEVLSRTDLNAYQSLKLSKSHYIENTILVSFDVKFVKRDQKQRRNGEACRARMSCFWSLVNLSLNFQKLISQICQYFLLKNCEKLLHCKSFSHFFKRKFQCISL